MSDKIRFSFSKQPLKKQKPSSNQALKFEQEDLDAEKPRKVLVTSITGGRAIGPQDSVKPEHLIIPVQSLTDDQGSVETRSNKRDYNKKTLESAAKVKQFGLVLMSSASSGSTSSDGSSKQKSSLLMKAQQKSSLYNDKKHDGDDELEETPLDAYNEVPVEEFGAALLRGMGWKELEEDEDNPDKKTPIMRPKNLGLGAKLPDIPPEMLSDKKRKRK